MRDLLELAERKQNQLQEAAARLRQQKGADAQSSEVIITPTGGCTSAGSSSLIAAKAVSPTITVRDTLILSPTPTGPTTTYVPVQRRPASPTGGGGASASSSVGFRAASMTVPTASFMGATRVAVSPPRQQTLPAQLSTVTVPRAGSSVRLRSPPRGGGVVSPAMQAAPASPTVSYRFRASQPGAPSPPVRPGQVSPAASAVSPVGSAAPFGSATVARQSSAVMMSPVTPLAQVVVRSVSAEQAPLMSSVRSLVGSGLMAESAAVAVASSPVSEVPARPVSEQSPLISSVRSLAQAVAESVPVVTASPIPEARASPIPEARASPVSEARTSPVPEARALDGSPKSRTRTLDSSSAARLERANTDPASPEPGKGRSPRSSGRDSLVPVTVPLRSPSAGRGVPLYSMVEFSHGRRTIAKARVYLYKAPFSPSVKYTTGGEFLVLPRGWAVIRSRQGMLVWLQLQDDALLPDAVAELLAPAPNLSSSASRSKGGAGASGRSPSPHSKRPGSSLTLALPAATGGTFDQLELRLPRSCPPDPAIRVACEDLIIVHPNDPNCDGSSSSADGGASPSVRLRATIGGRDGSGTAPSFDEVFKSWLSSWDTQI